MHRPLGIRTCFRLRGRRIHQLMGSPFLQEGFSSMGTTNGKTNGAGKDSVNLLDSAKGSNGNGQLPNSHKVYVKGKEGVRVPMREIALSGGEPPVRVYDTSGPEGQDVRQGIPPLREKWIRA